MSKFSGWKTVCIAVASVMLSLLGANVVRADSFSDQAAKLDVVGVHLGMTPAEAKSVLAQHRKGMRWLEGQNAALWGNSANGGERVDVAFSPPPGGPKVIGVFRRVWFDKSNAPTIENLAKSLNDKFGQSSTKSPPNSFSPDFIWVWDKDGQTAKATTGGCDPVNGYDRLHSLPYFMPVLKQENEGGCALAVEAYISLNGSTGITVQMEMALVDTHDALQAGIAADNLAKQTEQAKKEEELKKASANKPSL